jgi:hypothetical protein
MTVKNDTYNEYLKLRKEMNIPNNLEDIFEISSYFDKELKTYDGDEEIKKLMYWDHELFSCYTHDMILANYKSYRLLPFFGRIENDCFPDIKHFEKEREQFYFRRFEDEEILIMKVRYLEYLVEYGREKYKYFNSLVENTFLMVENISSINLYNNLISNVIYNALKFKQENTLIMCKELILEKINNLSEDNYYNLGEFSEFLFEIKKTKDLIITQEDISVVIENLKRVYTYFDKQNDLNGFIYIANELIKWYRFLDETEFVKKLQIAIGDAYIKESKFQNGREDKSLLVEVHFLEEAVNYFRNIGIATKVKGFSSI